MTRIVDPPREALANLRTPLTPGEHQVFEIFDANLEPEWEIYIQPHMNGLRPDFVLLSPLHGIGVFEVRDWDMKKMQYFIEQSSDGQTYLKAEKPPQGKSLKQKSIFQVDDPLKKIVLYKKELFDLYCPRLEANLGLRSITAGVVFTNASSGEIESVYGKIGKHSNIEQYDRQYPVSCAADVREKSIKRIFPLHNLRHFKDEPNKTMGEEMAQDLRGWLKEPAFSQEQRRPLQLDVAQMKLVDTRTTSGYRRIKGPAGSGKSVILAARAARLADEGKSVLIVSYNLTLLNYLRDLVARAVSQGAVLRRQIDFLNFHNWCKRICEYADETESYRSLWRETSEEGHEGILAEGVAELVSEIYSQRSHLPVYDAIFVDEGQDFRLSWWKSLRGALADGGEMVLAVDKTQDIYETADVWTEQSMNAAGFKGPWNELHISYRLPKPIIPYLRSYAETFLVGTEYDVPEEISKQLARESMQPEFAQVEPLTLRWVEARGDATPFCVDEINWHMTNLQEDTAYPDITFISGMSMGRNVVHALEIKKIKVLHTFAEANQRRQKRAFFQGHAKVKATTVHSFKGWEARHLVVHISSINRSKDKHLFYVAITRLLRSEYGCVLSVVSSCEALNQWARQQGPGITFS